MPSSLTSGKLTTSMIRGICTIPRISPGYVYVGLGWFGVNAYVPINNVLAVKRS